MGTTRSSKARRAMDFEHQTSVEKKRYLLPLTHWFHEKTHGKLESIASRIQRLWATPGIYAAAQKNL